MRTLIFIALSLTVTLPALVCGEEFKIGVSIPLTGPLAEYGTAVRKGIALAQEEHKELFKSIRFLFEDDRYEPKLTVSILQRMSDIEHVNLMFIWGNEPALAAAPIAESKKLPTLVVAQHPDAGRGYRYIVRFINPAADYSKSILGYLQDSGLKNLYVVNAELSFTNILLEELKNNLPPDGRLTIVETVDPTYLDFRSIILKLKGKQFDALGVYLIAPQVVQFYRQANELDFHPKTFGVTSLESGAVLKSVLPLMNGAVYAHVDASDEFRKRYAARFGTDDQITYAANAYDFAILAGKLFGQVDKNLMPDDVVTAFANVNEMKGVSGEFRYRSSTDSGQYFEFPVVVKEINNGSVKVIPGQLRGLTNAARGGKAANIK